MEGVGPEADVKIRACEHGTNCVGDGEMTTFHRSILIGGISASGTNGITKFSEERDNLWVAVELATLVKKYIFVGRRRSMLLEKST